MRRLLSTKMARIYIICIACHIYMFFSTSNAHAELRIPSVANVQSMAIADYGSRRNRPLPMHSGRMPAFLGRSCSPTPSGLVKVTSSGLHHTMFTVQRTLYSVHCTFYCTVLNCALLYYTSMLCYAMLYYYALLCYALL